VCFGCSVAKLRLSPAPPAQVAATEKGRTTGCLLVDEPAQLLWVADKDGWVYGEPLEWAEVPGL